VKDANSGVYDDITHQIKRHWHSSTPHVSLNLEKKTQNQLSNTSSHLNDLHSSFTVPISQPEQVD